MSAHDCCLNSGMRRSRLTSTASVGLSTTIGDSTARSEDYHRQGRCMRRDSHLSAHPPLETVRRLAEVSARAHWLSVLSRQYREAKRTYRALCRQEQRIGRQFLRNRYLELREYVE